MSASAPWVGLPIWLLLFRYGNRAIVSVAAVVFLGASLVAWRGMIDDLFLRFAVIGGIGSLTLLLFLIDRILVRRLVESRGVCVASFVFPTALTAMELILTRLSPYGSWSILGYTQSSNLPLIQMAAVTGVYGVSFLIGWVSSVLCFLVRYAFAPEESSVSLGFHRVRLLVVSCFVLSGSIFLMGTVRMTLSQETPSVRVAGITVDMSHLRGDVLHSVFDGSISKSDLKTYDAELFKIRDELFEATAREAHAGARLVLWPETNGAILAGQNDSLLDRAARTAKEPRIYLLITPTVIHPGKNRMDLRAALFGPDGSLLFDYDKTTVVPGDPNIPGPGKLPFAMTSFGKVSAAICFDGDFPGLIRQAGQGRADLLLLPSSDWREIDPVHSRMMVFRAIENGSNLFRQTNLGLSLAADYTGRVLGETDHFRASDRTLVVQMPTSGVWTPYSAAGDAFSWLAAIGFLILLTLAMKANVRRSEP